jgi:hypothetical protein
MPLPISPLLSGLALCGMGRNFLRSKRRLQPVFMQGPKQAKFQRNF